MFRVVVRACPALSLAGFHHVGIAVAQVLEPALLVERAVEYGRDGWVFRTTHGAFDGALRRFDKELCVQVDNIRDYCGAAALRQTFGRTGS